MSASLKPCPFCGGEPERAANSDAVRCRLHVGWLRIPEWNRRSDPSREAMREALELFERYCSENVHDATTSWESVRSAARAALALDGGKG